MKPVQLHAGLFFLFIALCFGTWMAIIIPPFVFVDEHEHFARVLEFSQGKLDSSARIDPQMKAYMENGIRHERLYKTLSEDQSHPVYSYPEVVAMDMAAGFQPEKKVYWLPRSRASVYSPAVYLPAIPAAWLAGKLNLPPHVTLLLLRFTLMAASIGLLYYAIQKTPVFRWAFCLLALLPVNVYLRGTISADSLTLAYALGFMALFFDCQYGKGPQKSILMQMAIASLMLCLSKSAYLLLPFVFFLIPRGRFANRRTYAAACICIVALPLLAGGLWLNFAREVAGRIGALSYPYVNSAAQIQHVLLHPLTYAGVLWETVKESGMMVLTSMVGFNTLGAVLIPFPALLSWAGIVLLLLLPEEGRPHLRHRAGYAGIALSSCVLLCSLFYAFYSNLDAESVNGLQGRYFTPYIPCLLAALWHKPYILRRAQWENIVLVYAVSALLYSAYLLYGCYIYKP